MIETCVEQFDRMDVLVSNAAFQLARESITDVPDPEWARTLATSLSEGIRVSSVAPRPT